MGDLIVSAVVCTAFLLECIAVTLFYLIYRRSHERRRRDMESVKLVLQELAFGDIFQEVLVPPDLPAGFAEHVNAIVVRMRDWRAYVPEQVFSPTIVTPAIPGRVGFLGFSPSEVDTPPSLTKVAVPSPSPVPSPAHRSGLNLTPIVPPSVAVTRCETGDSHISAPVKRNIFSSEELHHSWSESESLGYDQPGVMAENDSPRAASPSRIAQRLTSSTKLRERHASIVYVMSKNFLQPVASVSPTDVGAFASHVISCCEVYDGVIMFITGDEALGGWNTTRSTPLHAQQAARAALKIKRKGRGA
eukprot:Hpha_TRINITY_DN12914_c0_g1::TRINITY_DN12914_c0_g1_i1::g.164573::m.164573